MHTVRVEEIINRPIDQVCAVLMDVKNWVKLSNSFMNMDIILEDGNKHLTLQTTKHGREFRQYTIRKFHKNTIEFVHITSEFPLRQHHGEWAIEEISKGKARIILTHVYEVRFMLVGKLLEIIIGKYIFEKNIKSMLKDFKKGIEKWPEKE